MVYESGFTTRRTYSSRPVVTSYSVSYPSVTKTTRVYKTSYPIYSTSTYTRGARVISSPVRIVSSPSRIITRVIRSPSPVRVVRSTTTRVITSPERVTSYTYTTPSTYASTYLPSTYTSYRPYYPTSYSSSYLLPSYYYTPISRVYTRSLSPVRIITSPVRSVSVSPLYSKRYMPGYGDRALTSYLTTEPFTTFREETGKIRHRAQSLIRDLHTPVPRRNRSCTPFPVSSYEPSSELALDAYVSRITNPVRHIAKEVHRMSMYPDPPRKYVGRSHLSSIRICGNKAYDIRRPMYDSDKVHTDINILSRYLREKQLKEKCEQSHEKSTENVATCK
ncbi:uncharacterized protein CG45076 isoform X1 [Musca domestica]|uniref:Uncharacterized protein CG45076 isoform X1 n=1 Tax=Musca domestica TaxID=7370 RepID=A0A9J7D213_MUSDO|nr:uncharacterized protein CG45076 isoform X1 [Musca domestica]